MFFAQSWALLFGGIGQRQRRALPLVLNRNTYHTCEDCLPALVLVVTDGLQEHLSVLWKNHVLANNELVAGLVVGLDGKRSGESGIHGVDVYVHCIWCKPLFSIVFVLLGSYAIPLASRSR